MQQQESLQKSELGYGKVRVVHGLPTFASSDANAHLCRLDHRHIIGSIADGQCDRRRFHGVANELHQFSLLQGAYSAGNQHSATGRDSLKLLPLVVSIGAPNVTENFARHQKTATAQDLLLLLFVITIMAIPRCFNGVEIGTELIVQDLDVHVRGEHFGAETDVLGSFQLIPSEHPEFDASFPNLLDGIGDSILKFIFDGRGTNQLQ
mmetsp:Transcript_1420/g.3204  ORF Transcript_1420/g.3204 Transcript_1420/m.3204 type:complete len:207 (-) Transcript_1420:1043-1663(-)